MYARFNRASDIMRHDIELKMGKFRGGCSNILSETSLQTSLQTSLRLLIITALDSFFGLTVLDKHGNG